MPPTPLHYAEYSTEGHTFRALGETASQGRRALRLALLQHAQEHGLPRNWFEPAAIHETELLPGIGYRDSAAITGRVPVKPVPNRPLATE